MADSFFQNFLKKVSIQHSLRSGITFWFLVVSIIPFVFAIIFSLTYFTNNLNMEFKKRLEENHRGLEIELDETINHLKDLSEKNSEEEYLILATLKKNAESLDKITSYLLKLESLDELTVFDYDGNFLSKATNPALKKIEKASLNINRTFAKKEDASFNIFSPTKAYAQDDDFGFDIDVIDVSEDDRAKKGRAKKSALDLPKGLLSQIISEKDMVVKSIDKDYGLRIDAYQIIKEIAFDRIIGVVRSTMYIDLRFCWKYKKKTGIDLMIISPEMIASSIDKSRLGQVDFSDIYEKIENASYGDSAQGEKVINGTKYKYLLHLLSNDSEMLNAAMVLFLSKADFIESVNKMKITVLVVGLIILVLVIALSIYLTKIIADPITVVFEKLKEISQGKGDLTERIIVKSENEIGQLASCFNTFMENMQEIVKNIDGVSDSLVSISHDIVDKMESITKGTNAQISSVSSTLSSIEEVNASTKGIANSVNELSSSAEKSSSAVLQTDASVKELAKNSEVLSASVESSAMSINEMVASIKQVADNSGILHMVTNDTEDSMKQIEESINKIEDNANRTVHLSEQSTTDASTGMASVNETIKSINLINDSVNRSSVVIESLGKKISSIDEILDVIDNVAEQTNLLALNAAIIAAQAGEHGKGFAIVADEIKDLADRTAASTKEIANIIITVQKESKNAVEVMKISSENVTRSVNLSKESGDILKKILANAEQSTTRVKDIANSTVMQSKKTSEVMKSIIEVAEMVNQISSATKEQNVGSAMILKATESIKDIAYQLKTAVREQTVASKNISTEIVNISQMTRQINKSIKIQEEQSNAALSATRAINDNAKDNQQIINDLGKVVKTLDDKSDVLNKEIGKFKV